MWLIDNSEGEGVLSHAACSAEAYCLIPSDLHSGPIGVMLLRLPLGYLKNKISAGAGGGIPPSV